MSTSSDKAKQTKYLRATLKRATELHTQWEKCEAELLTRLVEQLCPFKPGDKIMRIPWVRGSWDMNHSMHWKHGELRVLKRVRFYEPTCAFDRNPLFEMVFDPSYGGTVWSGEVSFTLNQLKHSFMKVEK